MHKKLKILISNTQKLFNCEMIRNLALRNGFVKRTGKLDAKTFLNLCIFQGEDLCSASLLRLCSRLDSTHNISISPQALSKRFNANAVEFMKIVFNEMMQLQNRVLSSENKVLRSFFNRITIIDGTFITLPDEHREHYRGTKKNASAKIQLQYDFLTGEFILCDIMHGTQNDQSFISTTESTVQKGDLCLKDLGYYKTDNLKFIENNEAYYVSKVRIDAHIYKKEEIIESGFKGKTTIRKRYTPIDIYKLAEPLAEGKILELPEVYLGHTNKNKFKTRLIITKLTEEDKKKREAKLEKDLKNCRRKPNDLQKKWAEINYYITNVPTTIATTNQIHELYGLRWQVELMFKIWKSVFKIHLVKKTNVERFQCFLYGRLISLLLSSTIVFTSRTIIYQDDGKEISEIKSFQITQEYFNGQNGKIFNGDVLFSKLINKIFVAIKRFGIKSRKKSKKTPFLILMDIKITEDELEKIAV